MTVPHNITANLFQVLRSPESDNDGHQASNDAGSERKRHYLNVISCRTNDPSIGRR
jgi:hypothetical protein